MSFSLSKEPNFIHENSSSKNHYQDAESVSYQHPEGQVENADIDTSVIFSNQSNHRILLSD